MTLRGARGSSNGQLPSWFGLPFLLGGLLVIGFGFLLLMDELRFNREGAETSAVVVDRDYSPGGGDDGPTYTIRYEFAQPATGNRLNGSSDVSEETYDATDIGDTVVVTYLPAEPTKSRLGSTDLQLFVPLIVMGGGALFFVVGAGLLVLVPRLRRRAAAIAAATPVTSGFDADPSMEARPDPLAQVFLEPPAPPTPAAEHRPISDEELRAIDAQLARPAPPAPPAPAPAPGPLTPPPAQPPEGEPPPSA